MTLKITTTLIITFIYYPIQILFYVKSIYFLDVNEERRIKKKYIGNKQKYL